MHAQSEHQPLHCLPVPTWLKIVLVAMAVVLAFVASGVILVVRYARRHQTQWEQAADTALKDGERFGRGKDLDACVVESLARLDKCAVLAVTCESDARVFLQHCTLTAKMPADFCKDIPKQSEILRTANWAQHQCATRGARDVPRCTRIVTALQDYCGER
jgi:hypothetical protein